MFISLSLCPFLSLCCSSVCLSVSLVFPSLFILASYLHTQSKNLTWDSWFSGPLGLGRYMNSWSFHARLFVHFSGTKVQIFHHIVQKSMVRNYYSKVVSQLINSTEYIWTQLHMGHFQQNPKVYKAQCSPVALCLTADRLVQGGKYIPQNQLLHIKEWWFSP